MEHVICECDATHRIFREPSTIFSSSARPSGSNIPGKWRNAMARKSTRDRGLRSDEWYLQKRYICICSGLATRRGLGWPEQRQNIYGLSRRTGSRGLGSEGGWASSRLDPMRVFPGQVVPWRGWDRPKKVFSGSCAIPWPEKAVVVSAPSALAPQSLVTFSPRPPIKALGGVTGEAPDLKEDR